MESLYTPDLNLQWDEEVVPSTQLYSQPCSPYLHSDSNQSLWNSTHTALSLDHYATPQGKLMAVRTPLATVTNLNGQENVQGRPKARKAKKARKKPATSSLLTHPSSNATPLPQPNPSSDDKPPTNGQHVPPKLFFRSGYWSLKETVTLLDARMKLIESMKEAGLAATFKNQDERWEFISKYCVQRGVLRSAAQCLFRWDRISSAFKKVSDYERHIPSSCDSYWAMTPDQREEVKLPRNFGQDIYTSMLERLGTDRLINPRHIVYDTSSDMLGDASPKNDVGVEKKEATPTSEGESSSGKKRKRGDMSAWKKELEGTTRQLLSLRERIDSRKAKHDDDVIELTRSEFEEAVSLNRKRLALEEESNKALKDIAEAFKCLATNAYSHII